ncbi:MAG: hypothetical protein WB723_17880 [Candidatus Acidiferrales bacterium]
MSLALATQRDEARRAANRTSLARAAAILLGAMLMMWPAIFNRYPLLYPDSVTYLQDGSPVARALFLHQLSDYYGMRSFIYSLGILPFHWNTTLWPIVALQALLTAYIVWLVVRSILPRRTVLWYLALVAFLSLLTSASWFVSLIMPDILGPVLYLSIYLLVFARDTLSRPERIGAAAIACWAVASHATHLMLATGICLLLTALWAIFRNGFMSGRLKALGELAAIVMIAVFAQVALNSYLYGKPSLNGERPPFLTARLIADGPGRWYLEQHCSKTQFAGCGRLRDLTDDSDQFLWADDGVWKTSSSEVRERIRREEIPFALATLRAYPRAELSISEASFWQQLNSFEIGFDPNDWMVQQFDAAFPAGKARFLQSRQVANDLPFDFLSMIQNWTVVASLALIVFFGILLWRRWTFRLIGLALVIIPAVLANAFVTGVLSTVEDRYQSRVVWLVPFLAAILIFAWLTSLRTAPREELNV